MRTEVIGDATLILGNCLEVLPTLGRVDAVVTDPPYGMNWNTDSTRFKGGGSEGVARARIHGDDQPFDPAPILALDVPATLWGANHYAQRLPAGQTLIWLKQNPASYGAFLSDAELAWSSNGNGVWCFYRPRSIATAVLEGGGRVAHPTQKPVSLMVWCIERHGPDARTILDPYMGSGTTGVAALQLGRKFIGIELDPGYFDIACKRISEAWKQPRLFEEPKRKPEPAPNLFDGAQP
jgi:DNA modification methylase